MTKNQEAWLLQINTILKGVFSACTSNDLIKCQCACCILIIISQVSKHSSHTFQLMKANHSVPINVYKKFQHSAFHSSVSHASSLFTLYFYYFSLTRCLVGWQTNSADARQTTGRGSQLQPRRVNRQLCQRTFWARSET